jgi:hypothetical protein
MTHLVKIHPDILIVLNDIKDETFKMTTIRQHLMKLSPHYKNLDTVRIFVSRHLTDLVNRDILSCCNKKRNKNYKKNAIFHTIKFYVELSSQKKDKERMIRLKHDDKKVMSENCVNDLIKQKEIMEIELSTKLAEIEQYQVMMEQFPETASFALNFHAEAKENAALISGKIRAITNILSYQPDAIHEIQRERVLS